MSIKPGANQENKIDRDNKWGVYERWKNRLSCLYGWDSKQNSGRYERAVKLICKIIKL